MRSQAESRLRRAQLPPAPGRLCCLALTWSDLEESKEGAISWCHPTHVGEGASPHPSAVCKPGEPQLPGKGCSMVIPSRPFDMGPGKIPPSTGVPVLGGPLQ